MYICFNFALIFGREKVYFCALALILLCKWFDLGAQNATKPFICGI